MSYPATLPETSPRTTDEAERGLASHGAVSLVFERFGPAIGEPLLLIAGMGVQMLIWNEDFCAALVEAGFQVARFDNRDIGLSTHLTEAGTPRALELMLRPRKAAPYRLEDMADDAVAVLDALGWRSAHIVGASMGGMIGQIMAVRHPSRLRTLTSIMSAPSPRLGTRLGTLMGIMRLGRQTPRDPAEAGRQMVALKRLMASPGYPLDEDWLDELGRRSFARGFDAAGQLRQRAAIAASRDRRRELRRVRVPTLVLHGANDPVIRSRCGRATASAIPGARLVMHPGMGHDLPRPLWPLIVADIRDLAARRRGD